MGMERMPSDEQEHDFTTTKSLKNFFCYRSAANVKFKVLCDLFQVKPMMQKDFSKVAGVLWRSASQDTKDEFSEYAAKQSAAQKGTPTRSKRKGKTASRGVQKKRGSSTRRTEDIPYPDHTPWHFPPAGPALPLSPYSASTPSSSFSSPGPSTWDSNTPASSVASIEDEPFKVAELEQRMYENAMMAAARQGANAVAVLQNGPFGQASVPVVAGIGPAGFPPNGSPQHIMISHSPARTQQPVANVSHGGFMPHQWYLPQQAGQATDTAQPTQLPLWDEACAPLDAGFVDFESTMGGSASSSHPQPQIPVQQPEFTYRPLTFAPVASTAADTYDVPSPRDTHRSLAIAGPQQIPTSMDRMPLMSQDESAYDPELYHSSSSTPVPYVPAVESSMFGQETTGDMDFGTNAHEGRMPDHAAIPMARDDIPVDDPSDGQELPADTQNMEWLQDLLFDSVGPETWFDTPAA
ncbi:hypothetical protein FKP32DRAFT_513838 [Trametes sanguinea]|nr:hypothetical protein FKP32DRAFT_513838 [Trametes sanguinea]